MSKNDAVKITEYDFRGAQSYFFNFFFQTFGDFGIDPQESSYFQFQFQFIFYATMKSKTIYMNSTVLHRGCTNRAKLDKMDTQMIIIITKLDLNYIAITILVNS